MTDTNNIGSSDANSLLPITSREFAVYTVDDFIGFTVNLIPRVSVMVPLAGIKPTPAEVQAGVDDLIDKKQKAMNGGRIERMARNLSHKSVIGQVRLWATYVDFVADGDVMVVIESGFQARRASTPSVVPGVPTNFRAAYDKDGRIILRCKAGRNARNFSIQYALSVDGPWIDCPLTTKARGTVVPGLTPGTMYWFRIRANGAAGSSNYTVPTCKIAI